MDIISPIVRLLSNGTVTPSPTAAAGAINTVITSHNASSGLIAYGIVCFIGVIIFTVYMVWRFARPGAPLIALGLVYLSWLIVFSLCFLVPMDLLPDIAQSLDQVWNVLFWASFLLMWFIIPFASGYYDNGGFTVKHKLWQSTKFNAYLFLTVGIIALAGVIYLSAAASWTMDAITGLVVCLSNTWGLIMLVLCAGYGLVEFPRSIYHTGNYQRRRDYIYFTAAEIQNEAEETRDQLAATIKLLKKLESKIDSSGNEKHQRWLTEIQSVVREREIQMAQSKTRTHPTELPIATEMSGKEPVTTNQMFKLHYHSKSLVRHLSLVETQWRDTVNDAVALNAELEAQSVTNAVSVSWWLRTGRKHSYTVFTVCGIILTILLVFCEITITTTTDVSPLGLIVKSVRNNFVLQQIFTAGPFLYLSACTYYPLFMLRLSRLYYIGRRRTDEGTLLLNATLMLRVCTPLAYNFVLLLRIPATALENLIGVITVIPFFGGSFTTSFPILIAIFNIIWLFNLPAYIGSCLNMQQFRFIVANRQTDSDVTDAMEEGKNLIENELRYRKRDIALISQGSANSNNPTIQRSIEDIADADQGIELEGQHQHQHQDGEEYYEDGDDDEYTDNTTAAAAATANNNNNNNNQDYDDDDEDDDTDEPVQPNSASSILDYYKQQPVIANSNNNNNNLNYDMQQSAEEEYARLTAAAQLETQQKTRAKLAAIANSSSSSSSNKTKPNNLFNIGRGRIVAAAPPQSAAAAAADDEPQFDEDGNRIV